jgi:hypothetical protein
MATSVQIELQVDEKGAVSGVRSFDTATKQASGTVRQLGADLTKVQTQVVSTTNTAANSVASFNARMSAAMASYNAQAARSVEVQKLLGAEFDRASSSGLTYVAAMERATAAAAAYTPVARAAAAATRGMSGSYGEARIAASALMGSTRGMAMGLANVGSRMSFLAPLWKAAMPIAVGVAAVSIIAQLGGEAYNLYEKYISLDAAAEEYQKTLEKTKEEDYWKSDSIETTTMRIREATSAAIEYRSTAEQMSHAGWGMIGSGILSGDLSRITSGISFVGTAHSAASDSVKKEQAVDKLQPYQAAQQHELNVQQIEFNHALDGELQGRAKINAEMQKRVQLAAEERSYNAAQNRAHGNPIASDAGAAKEKLADQIAQRESAAQTYNLNREHAEELRRIHEQALESGLRGSALYQAQEDSAIAELRQKGIASAGAVNDIRTRFHNEEMKRLQDQERETAKLGRSADMAGLTGIARVQTEGANQIANIDDEDIDPAEKAKRKAFVEKQTAADVAAEQLKWSQKVDEVVEASSDKQVSGFARIRAEADKARAELMREFEAAHNMMDLSQPGQQKLLDQDTVKLSVGLNAIDKSSDTQQSGLADKNARETAQIEAEANRRSLSAMKQQTAAIEAEYDERLQKYKDERINEGLSDDDYNRRVAAAAKERDADMVAASTSAREKMAGEFDHLFKSLDHPMEALKDMGDKVAGEAAARLVQHFQQRGQPGTTPIAGGESGSFFDDLLGGFGLGGGKHGMAAHTGAVLPPHELIPVGATPAAAAARAAVTPAHVGSITAAARPDALSIGTAMIRVGTASIAFGGGAGVGSMPAGGTSLLASGLPSTGVGTRAAGAGGSVQDSTASAAAARGTVGAITGIAGPRGLVSTSTAVPPSSGSGMIGTGGSVQGSTIGAAAARGTVGAITGIAGPRGLVSTSTAVPSSSGGGMIGTGGSVQGFTARTAAAAVTPGAISGSAGAASGAQTSPAPASGNFTTGGGTPPPKGAGMTGALNNISSGLAVAQAAKKNFGAGSGSGSDVDQEAGELSDPYDTQDSGTSNKGIFGESGATDAKVVGAAQGAVGMYAAYEGNGGIGGMLSGAMSGMQLGSELGGPIGAGIGAGVGAVVGAIGFGGREKARVYDLQQTRPRINNDMDAFQQGTMDYLGSYSDMESAQTDAQHATSKMGPAAGSYFNDTIKPEIATFEQKLSREQKAGRSASTFSAAQYADGTDYVPGTGMALIHEGERIFPSKQNEQITRALTSGVSSEQAHSSYASTMQARDAGSTVQGGDRTLNMHVYAHDTKSVAQFFEDNIHHIRRSLNSSYGQYGGLADA